MAQRRRQATDTYTRAVRGAHASVRSTRTASQASNGLTNSSEAATGSWLGTRLTHSNERKILSVSAGYLLSHVMCRRTAPAVRIGKIAVTKGKLYHVGLQAAIAVD